MVLNNGDVLSKQQFQKDKEPATMAGPFQSTCVSLW